MSMAKKTTMPAWDMKMSNLWGVGLGADALFGIKVQDKLCWPPKQVDGDDTVERVPSGVDWGRMSSARDVSTRISHTHPEIMTTPRVEYINEPELFGGDTNGTGGVRGLVSWLPGRLDQLMPAHIASRLGLTPERCPALRGVASIFFSGGRKPKSKTDSNGLPVPGGIVGNAVSSDNQGFVWGTNDPYVPNASVRAFRAPVAEPLREYAAWWDNPNNVAYGAQMMTRIIQVPKSPPRKKSNGKGDLPAGGGFPAANPSAALFELLSSASYDVNAGDEGIDAESFILAARMLSVEKAGISFGWIEQDTVKSVAEEICEHIGGAMFVHPKTGKYTLRLLRPDSSFKAMERNTEIMNLPWLTGFRLTPANARLDGDMERKSWSDVVNFVSVKYTDDETGEVKAISVQAPELIAAAGGRINDTTLNYWMFRSAETAHTAGERALAAMSRPLMKASWVLNRSAWALAPYDVITVDWPSEGLANTRFRVMAVDYGDGKDAEIRIEAIEDVFSEIPRRSAFIPQATLWTPPPRPTIRQPYMTPASAPVLLRHGVSLDELTALDADGDAVMIHLLSSDASLSGADAFVKTNGEPLPSSPVPIDSVPRALLIDPLPAEPTSVISFYDLKFGAQETDPEPGDLLIIVRPRPDKPTLDRYWTTIGGGNQNPGNLPGPGYGNSAFPNKLHWGIGTAALALDPDSARSTTLRGLAPAFHEEVCVIRSVDRETGETTIIRGAFDTVPAPIPAGAWVHHVPNRPPVPRQVSPDGEVMYAAYRPKNASAVARQTTQQYQFVPTARQDMPARPGNVRLAIAGETWELGSKPVLEEAAPITVNWATRNRLLDDASPALWTAGNITPEPGQRHYVRVWRRVRRNADGDAPAVLVQAFYDLSGSVFTIPAAVFSGSMSDPEWNPGPVETDIPSGAAFVIEVGAQRTQDGKVLVATPETPATGPAQMSAQAALLLVDIGTSPGGWGNNWGREWGG